MSDSDERVEIFHRVNKLKLKAGGDLYNEEPGYVAPSAVDRAQSIIDRKETLYKNEVEDVLKNLDSAWKKMKSESDEEKAHGAEELYHYANHVKDLAATFGYSLMEYFGASLREFAEKIDVAKPQHLIIVQAHLDVMWVTYKSNIKDDGGEKADELKSIISEAIKKYF